MASASASSPLSFGRSRSSGFSRARSSRAPTVQEAEEEEQRLKKANTELEHEIHQMHLKLLELGDPTEKPIARCELVDDQWVIEGYEEATEPGIEIRSDFGQKAEILNCVGKKEQININVKGTTKKVLVENCEKARICVDCVLFEIEIQKCKDIVICVGGECPNMRVEHCDSVGILICHALMDGQLYLRNCGGIVVNTVERSAHSVLYPEHLLAAKKMRVAEVPAYIVTTPDASGPWTSGAHLHPQDHE